MQVRNRYIIPIRAPLQSFAQHTTIMFWLVLSEPCLIEENARKASQLTGLTRSVSKTSARLILMAQCDVSEILISDFSKRAVAVCKCKCKCVLWFRVKGNKQMYQMRPPWLKRLI